MMLGRTRHSISKTKFAEQASTGKALRMRKPASPSADSGVEKLSSGEANARRPGQRFKISPEASVAAQVESTGPCGNSIRTGIPIATMLSRRGVN